MSVEFYRVHAKRHQANLPFTERWPAIHFACDYRWLHANFQSTPS